MFKELNILKIFLESPTKEFNVREAARTLKITPATASSKLKFFSKDGLLKGRKERNLLLYRADLDRDKFRDLKLFYNIRKLKESGFVEELNKFYLKPAIILFGSAAYGLDTEESDMDLAIISENKKDFPSLKQFEKKLNRRLQLFVVSNIKDLKNKHLINNVLNGRVIQGEVKWI